MKALTRGDILAAEDRERIEYEIKEWGGSVYIWDPTVTQALKILDLLQSTKEGNQSQISPELMVEVIQICVKDKYGKPLFSSDDIGSLKEKNHKVVMALFNKCVDRLNKSDSKKNLGTTL
jgi:hypothetical protein